jgi:hypothetical protein
MAAGNGPVSHSENTSCNFWYVTNTGESGQRQTQATENKEAWPALARPRGAGGGIQDPCIRQRDCHGNIIGFQAYFTAPAAGPLARIGMLGGPLTKPWPHATCPFSRFWREPGHNRSP